MKLVNGGGGGGGGMGGGGEKSAFSFKKCSAFQFVKRKVSLREGQYFGRDASQGVCVHLYLRGLREEVA